MNAIIAWEDEDGGQTVWGTHDPFEAKYEYNKYIIDNYGQPTDREQLTSVADWEDDSQKLWGDPSLPDKEEWDIGDFSPVSWVGSIPFLHRSL